MTNFLEEELSQEGYYAESYSSGREGLKTALAEDRDWDLIITGLMIPELSGIEICRRVRQNSHVPIFIIDERDSVVERVLCLDYGADDYLVEPFAIEELFARMRAIFRRIKYQSGHQDDSKSSIFFKDLVVDKENRTVRRGKEIIDLTKREYDLLIELLSNPE